MGIETEGVDSIEELLASGKLSEDASIEEIEAALNGQQPAVDATTEEGKSDEADKTAEEGKSESEFEKVDNAAGETQGAAQATATDGKQGAEQTSSARDQQTGEASSEADEEGSGSFRDHPIYGVLKGTRSNLSEARRKLQEAEQHAQEERERREQAERELNDLRGRLQQQNQDTRDVQAAATAAGVKGDVRTIDTSKLRDNFPAEIVDAIEALQTQNATLNRVVTELRERDAGRVQTEEERAQEALQADIDSVPALAAWQAEGKLKWKAACALDDALRADPEWQGKSRVERYQEIARQLGGAPQQQSTSTATPAAAGTKAKVEQAIAAAAARAVPLSHSGLPAGSPPAQSEAESLENLDAKQIEDKFSKMSPEQLEALLARVG